MEPKYLAVQGARVHNLRNVRVRLPRGRLICFTGVSGSGKSSLAFDTLFAEGQRRYIESLSAYARQFLGQLPKPDVDQITGLSPAVAIQQKSGIWNPRSTVGTVTQIYDFLRVLYARVGTQHCPECGRVISAQSREQIVAGMLEAGEGTAVLVLAPVVRGQKGEHRELMADLLRQGFARARVDGEVVNLSAPPELKRNVRHSIEVVVDRLVLRGEARARIAEAVETALRVGDGTVIVQPMEGSRRGGRREWTFSSRYACTHCRKGFDPPSPQMFSFNSPAGMCRECEGLGERVRFDPELLVPDPGRSFWESAIEPLGPRIGRWRRHIYQGVADHLGVDLGRPWKDLPASARHALLYGTGDAHITFSWRWRGGVWRHGGTFGGVIAELEEKYRRASSRIVRRYYEKYMRRQVCPSCGGTRLNAQARNVRLGGVSLPELCARSVREVREFLEGLRLEGTAAVIAAEAIKEIRGRLSFLEAVGLGYLTLDRSAPSLSGGESQRIRLAAQIGSGLSGVLYVLDEPSIGLHHRDNGRLLDALERLRDQGNTVIVVEHDEETMRRADWVVDFGPGPGVRGGEIVAEGPPDAVVRSRRSVTGAYLRGERGIAVPAVRRPVSADGRPPRRARTGRAGQRRRRAPAPGNGGERGWLWVLGAAHNNLKNIDVGIPLGRFVCVTGVSGSGKSSLINDILWQRLARDVNGSSRAMPGRHRDVVGMEQIDKAINIDQSPIGRTPRSNPATYIKVFDEIRGLYARLPDARVRGYRPGRFSFNVPFGARGGGRCEACEGHGANRIEMELLADIWVPCPVCGGKRFNHETLQILFRGKSIADVLEMDVQEALEHFANQPRIAAMLQTLHDVGLDYMKLGQSSTTLSGGEAQRVKLARELVKRRTGRTLYILDEPTTGLHFEDISRLLAVLHRFVDEGNTVVVIEHNLEVIKTADWIIDLGPEGGDEGGYVVATGTPEQIAARPESWTGRALAEVLHGQVERRRGAALRGGEERMRRAAARASRAAARGNGADSRYITVEGAEEHNLKHISVRLPRGRMTVCTGVSGSGKSSFALDTVFAEGQRRYVESLSAYARQFLGRLNKPRVERITGLQPAIAIEQKGAGKSPRSTVGTITEVYDYMRVLWSRLGEPYCPRCQVPVGAATSDQITERIVGLGDGTRALLLAPVQRVGRESWEDLIRREMSNGYRRARIDGQVVELREEMRLDGARPHTVELVVDRVTVRRGQRSRIAESVEHALAVGGGVVVVVVVDENGVPAEEMRLSQHRSCERCGTAYEPLNPHHFSFNSRLGWCPVCEGLGVQRGTDVGAVIVHPGRSLLAGAVAGWGEVAADSPLGRCVVALARGLGFDPATPWNRLTAEQQRVLLWGSGDRWFDASDIWPGVRFQWRGFMPAIDHATRVSWTYRSRLEGMVRDVPCRGCGGQRLRADAAAVRFAGRTLHEVGEMPLSEALEFFRSVRLEARERRIAGELLHEITSRLRFLVDVGVEYLTLNRTAPTLSGGEAQRIRLASQLGSGLTGVLYVLDEPTIGLHPRDNRRLVQALHRLRDLGNTLLLVEHDREVIEGSDRVVDFGPGAGGQGGQIVAEGTPAALKRRSRSLTGRYLSGREAIGVPAERRPVSPGEGVPQAWLCVRGARHNNLKGIDASFPLGRFIAVTGVSGSGKSSLVTDVLLAALAQRLHRAGTTPGDHDAIEGLEHVDKVINVDQSPIGNTPASNAATYTGVFNGIRELFARLPESRVRGYNENRFSFNRPGGRCEVCEGQGQRCIEMHFLPDVWVPCEACGGKRYNAETLEVRYRGRNIADVLEMSVREAMDLFAQVPRLRRMLETLDAVGLGYLPLGQPAPTLSGGEAQRVKLAAELGRPQTGRTVYILDEPTTGLHFDDLRRLLEVLQRLVDLGNTVICIEHNLDLIKCCDWVIDLGPEAGEAGGRIVAAGPPEMVARCAASHTGRFLRPVLESSPRIRREVYDASRHAAEMLERESPMRLPPDVAEAPMPWERDGRRWHLQERTDRKGQPIRWQRDLLARIVAYVESLSDAWLPTDWNDRARVEIKARGAGSAWFLHALTGDAWLLDVVIRVPRGTFSLAALRSALRIPTLDEREDLPIYGQWQRVETRRAANGMQEVRLYLHDEQDVRWTALSRFLKQAAEAYLAFVASRRGRGQAQEPWKSAGVVWHTSGRSVQRSGRRRWTGESLLGLVGQISKALPEARADWGRKRSVCVSHPAVPGTFIQIATYAPECLKVRVAVRPGVLTPARVAGLGESPVIHAPRRGVAWVEFAFEDLKQVDVCRLREVLKAAAESWRHQAEGDAA